MASGQSTQVVKLMASSPAVWLPQGICGGCRICVRRRSNCGSQPAGDGVGSVNSGGEADGLIASSLAPTGDLWWLQDLRTTEIKLWEPAGDGGGSVNSGGEADGLIASKLAPTGIVALIRLSTAADTAVRRTATVSETPGADRRSVVAGAGRNRQGIAGAPRR